MMKSGSTQKHYLYQVGFPLLASFIWGTAIVAQRIAAGHIGPFAFNAARSAVGALFLFVLCMLLRHRNRNEQQAQVKTRRKDLLLGGTLCGIALTAGAIFQQKGLETATAGKAGFISSLYIVIVPAIGLIMGRKISWPLLTSIFLALPGLYLLCVQDNFTIEFGDVYILAGSLSFAVHILLVDRFAQRVNGVELSCMQFSVSAVLCAIGMFIMEGPQFEAMYVTLGPILYVGIFSCGVAYTLQIVAQKHANPVVVSLLLSMESVFSALVGAIFLGERMGTKEYVGCIFMLSAIIFAQLPGRKKAASPK